VNADVTRQFDRRKPLKGIGALSVVVAGPTKLSKARVYPSVPRRGGF
jgi:hypothetical protein